MSFLNEAVLLRSAIIPFRDFVVDHMPHIGRVLIESFPNQIFPSNTRKGAPFMTGITCLTVFRRSPTYNCDTFFCIQHFLS